MEQSEYQKFDKNKTSTPASEFSIWIDNIDTTVDDAMAIRSKDPIGCIWIKDLTREKEMEMDKLDDISVRNHWILYLFPFLFLLLQQILIQTQP